MRKLRMVSLAVALTLAPLLTSCWPFRRARTAPPPAPAPTSPQTPPPAPQTPSPGAAPGAGETPHPPAATPPKSAQPEETRTVTLPAPKKRPSPLGPPAQPSPAGPSETEAPPAAPPPQLRQILTPEQQRELNRTVDARIGRARYSLAALRGHSLTRKQAATVEQIQTFIRQAEEARPNDLMRASNLAERADVLAQDLLRSLR